MRAYNIYIKTFIYAVSFLFGGVLAAQQFQINGIALPSNFSTSTIGGMTQDNLGNIWLATLNQGLFKYNGTAFTPYSADRRDDASVVSDRLECIATADDGRIWVGSFSDGISVLDPLAEVFTNYVYDEDDEGGIRNNSIRSLARDPLGGMWIGTNSGIDYWNPETNQFEHDFADSPDARLLQKEHVRVLYFDNAGILWAGASSPFIGEETEGGLFRIDTKSKTVKRYVTNENPNSLTNNVVTVIKEDSRGNFWVGTAGDGLHSMDKELGTFQRHGYDPSDPTKLSRPEVKGFEYALDHIRFIEEDDSGKLWIGTMNNGINVYDPELNTVTHLTDGAGPMPVNDWWGSIKSDDGLIWLASWISGGEEQDQVLFRVDLNPLDFSIYETNGPVYAFGLGSDGVIYGGYSNVLYRNSFQGEFQTEKSIVIEEPDVDFYHFNTKHENDIWVSTSAGLLYTDKYLSSYQLYPVYDQTLALGELLEVNATASISPDSILVGTSNGLFLFDAKSEKYKLLDLDPAQKADRSVSRVNDVLIDASNQIWVAFQTYGLKKLSPDLKEFKDYEFVENVQDGVMIIYENDKKNLFVGNRRSGLRIYRPDSDSFDPVVDKSGFLEATHFVGGVISVTDDILWVNSDYGVIAYNLVDSSSSVIDTDLMGNYTFTSFRFFSDHKGDHYIGTNGGIIRYRPEQFMSQSNNSKPPVISNFSVENVSMSSEIEDHELSYGLTHNENNVSFRINNVDFKRSNSTRLEYLLENYDSDWRTGQNDEEVFYYKLPSGSYTFKVRVEDVQEAELQSTLSFKILPPWWLTWWAYLIYGLIAWGGLMMYNKYQRQRAIRTERERAREKELKQAKEIEKAYTELKATQEQLIQSEKMASLGELTAGIAHEIQNPLNFVNNFSEVSSELIEEMIEEMTDGDIDEAKSISEDLKKNLEKIVHHGKRADSIVKGMLLHSRSGTDEKVLTSINALADEYLRLSYHGLRAKDSLFNADFKTDFDLSIEEIPMVPQEVGRVLLNLITNAFHAVHERNMAEEAEYSPMVIVKTAQEESKVILSVIDNGNGIPEEMKSKIFQPFFTTKEAGKGTGLGLSISYDIIKSMGGEILVNSQEGEGTEFVISFVKNSN